MTCAAVSRTSLEMWPYITNDAGEKGLFDVSVAQRRDAFAKRWPGVWCFTYRRVNITPTLSEDFASCRQLLLTVIKHRTCKRQLTAMPSHKRLGHSADFRKVAISRSIEVAPCRLHLGLSKPR